MALNGATYLQPHFTEAMCAVTANFLIIAGRLRHVSAGALQHSC